MRNVCLIFSYDGSSYHGFQSQDNALAVQDVLEEALYRLTGEKLELIGSGRTDAGVHARGQVVNFHTSSPIPLSNWTRALNGLLPEDIVIRHTIEVPASFHASFSAIEKTYRYSIYNDRVRDVFQRKYHLHYPIPLNWEEMKRSIAHLVGEYDFTSFCSVKSTKRSHVRSIYRAEILDDEVNPHVKHIFITGNGFLYNMVRIIVGTLLEVGRGRRSSDDIPRILRAQNRSTAGPTARPHALMLWEVKYKEIADCYWEFS